MGITLYKDRVVLNPNLAPISMLFVHFSFLSSPLSVPYKLKSFMAIKNPGPCGPGFLSQKTELLCYLEVNHPLGAPVGGVTLLSGYTRLGYIVTIDHADFRGYAEPLRHIDHHIDVVGSTWVLPGSG